MGHNPDGIAFYLSFSSARHPVGRSVVAKPPLDQHHPVGTAECRLNAVMVSAILFALELREQAKK